MTLGRYWTGTIDGIDLLDTDGEAAAFQLVGADSFAVGSVTGNTLLAADGTPQTQYVPLSGKGERLEVRFVHIPAVLLAELLASLRSHVAAATDFAASFADGFQAIDRRFKPDVPAWYERGEPDGGYVKGVVLRLICTL